MRGQEFIDRGSAPVEIIFGENRLMGNTFVGVGVSLSGISAFKSSRKPGIQNDRTGGG
jgi:hypothetical protein